MLGLTRSLRGHRRAVRRAQPRRVAASRSRDDPMRLEPLDILTSPVFSLSAIDE
jgi:hypothetical protein